MVDRSLANRQTLSRIEQWFALPGWCAALGFAMMYHTAEYEDFVLCHAMPCLLPRKASPIRGSNFDVDFNVALAPVAVGLQHQMAACRGQQLGTLTLVSLQGIGQRALPRQSAVLKGS